MAEGHDPIAKLKEQVTCPVCWDVFTQPKLLACAHAFCMDCIDHLPVDLVNGDHTIYCPTCREPTTLPSNEFNSVTSLRSAFLINSLIEVHQSMESSVAATDKPKDKKCLKHDRPLELYCDDCQQMLCAKCAHAGHRDHNCDYISDFVARNQTEILDNLQPVQQQLCLVLDALDNLDIQKECIAAHGEAVKSEIDALIDQLVQAVHQSGATLKENVDTLVNNKLKSISAMKQQGKMFYELLKSCEQYVQEKLRSESQQEILLERSKIMERLRASQQLILPELQLKEKADIVFQHSHDLLEKCSKIGEVSEDVDDTGSTDTEIHTILKFGIKYKPPVKLASGIVAIADKPSTIDLKVPNVSRLKRNSLSCCLVPNAEGVATQCEIKHVEKETYRISFTASQQGIHRVKVQVKGMDVAYNPCTVQVAAAIKDVRHPTGIAITANGLLVAVDDTSIAVLDKEGHVISRSNGQNGNSNRGICVTPDNHILVVGKNAPHVKEYVLDSTLFCTLYNTANTSQGNGPLQFNWPHSIAVSTSGQIYVCDTANHRIQVLNPDLTFSRMFGEKGSGPGQFVAPCGLAIDSHDVIYVCDNGNERIQKLTSSGTYISEFHVPHPQCIAIDYNMLYITTDTIAIYTTDGEAVNEGGAMCGVYKGVVVDEEHAYVCDYDNDQIIVF